MTTRSGQCMCGKVTVTVDAERRQMSACHCQMCRRWASGPFFGIDCKGSAKFGGQEHIGLFDSSSWAQRGFCKSCGSCLYYQFKGKERFFVAAGLFDEADELAFEHEIFVDDQPASYAFANQTKRYTSEEVIELFAK